MKAYDTKCYMRDILTYQPACFLLLDLYDLIGHDREMRESAE